MVIQTGNKLYTESDLYTVTYHCSGSWLQSSTSSALSFAPNFCFKCEKSFTKTPVIITEAVHMNLLITLYLYVIVYDDKFCKSAEFIISSCKRELWNRLRFQRWLI